MATKTQSKSAAKRAASAQDKALLERRGAATEATTAPEPSEGRGTGPAPPQTDTITGADVLRAGGDIDVAKVDPGSGKGEVPPLVLPGTWVKLGKHKDVPEQHEGSIAVVIEGPDTATPLGTGNQVLPGYNRDKGRAFTVRTRDAGTATLIVPREAFTYVGADRVTVAPKV